MLHYSLKSSLGHKKIQIINVTILIANMIANISQFLRNYKQTKNSCSLFKFTSLLIDGRLKLDCNTLRSGGDENERNNDGSRVCP